MTNGRWKIKIYQEVNKMDREIEGRRTEDSRKTDPDRKRETETQRKKYLSERFNYACVLRGEVKHIEEIKEHIVQKYVDTGLIKLIRPTYDKTELYILTDQEWKKYQMLKQKDDRLRGCSPQ